MKKMLPTNDIPNYLWANQMLHMPKCLSDIYEELLLEHGLWELANDQNNQGRVIGGISETESMEYFALRFGVSTTRIQSLLLDPDDAYSDISNDLLSIFSENNIVLLDMACGPGSAGTSILSNLYVLRKDGVIPKLPLKINVVGGDCSPVALELYTKIIEKLSTLLETVGIQISLVTKRWMAERSHSTSELFDILFEQGYEAKEYVLIVANFSGAMDNHFNDYRDSIVHIFDRMHDKECSVYWVEPANYKSAEKLFNRLKQIVDRAPWSEAKNTGPISHDYHWYHPFQLRTLPCRVLLKAFDKRTK